MKFVAEHTSIPVSKVYCSFVYKDRAFILMERIRGDAIPNAWGKLPEAARQKVYSQLEEMIHELRALEPSPETGVQNCLGGELFDSRITRCPTFGPFKTIQDFHFSLRDGLTPTAGAKHNIEEGEWQDIEKMVAMQDSSWPPPVFTHGDLNPANIIVRGDKVVGIIDWEFAGWYPHYWEYTSAWYGNVTRTDWRDAIDRFLEPFPAELVMEGTRNRWWGEI
jgi:serine/threonine protein kinase